MTAPQQPPPPQYPAPGYAPPPAPPRRRRIWPWFVMAAGAALVVAVGATVSTRPPASSTTTPPAATSGAAQAAAPAQDAADGSADHPLAFGKTWQPAGKMGVTIGVPAPFKPSESAFSPDHAPRAVVMDVTVANVAGAPAVPAMAISVQATAGASQAQEIVDVGNGVGGSPTANILPGKSLTWKVAFGVPAGPTEFTVQVSTIVGGQTVYFTGKV